MKAFLKQRTSQTTCLKAAKSMSKTLVRTYVFKPVPPSLVGDCVIRVVCNIWARLVGGGCGGGALPSADIHRGQVLGHLSHLSSTARGIFLSSQTLFCLSAGKYILPNNST